MRSSFVRWPVVRWRSTAIVAVAAATTLLAPSSLPVMAAPEPAAPEPAAPGTSAVSMEPVFNEPADDGQPDHAIEDRLVELVDATPAGEQIDFSVYSWTRKKVALALERAQQRGVQVRVAVDGGPDERLNPDVTDILDRAHLTKLVYCGTGGSDNTACIANRGDPHSINHNKLWMFSETEGKEDVVAVASYNLTKPQGNLFNNALITSGDPDLYDFYRGHVDRMLAQDKDNDYFDHGGYHRSPDSKVTSYLSPRADSEGGTSEEAGTDTWAQLLQYAKKREPGCQLDIVHANISDARTPAVQEIQRIARLGCQVRLVYGTIGDDSLERLQGEQNVQLKRYSENDEDNWEGREIGVHSKYVLYRGQYNETDDRSLVFTGSHNLSGPALRTNDEILIKVDNEAVKRAYDGNFETVWNRAKCTNPEEGSCP